MQQRAFAAESPPQSFGSGAILNNAKGKARSMLKCLAVNVTACRSDTCLVYANVTSSDLVRLSQINHLRDNSGLILFSCCHINGKKCTSESRL